MSVGAEVAHVKKEPESQATELITDQVRVTEELLSKVSVEPYELYADHVVKDELVLGPERPHRPHVGLTTRSRTPAATCRGLQRSPQSCRGAARPSLKGCFVRLERLPLPTLKTGSTRKTHETSEPVDKRTLRPKLNTNHEQNNTEIPRAVSSKSSGPKQSERQKIKGKLNAITKSITAKQLKRQKITKGNQSFICDDCGKICKFKHTLIQHLRYHLPHTTENLQTANTVNKPYCCDICDKEVSCLGSLKRHLNIHAGIKRHSCDVCGKKFLESSCFKRHKLTHTNEKPEFPCDVCKKIFTSSSNVKVHKRNVHLGLKPYSCELCEKKYNTLDALKKHKLSHFPEMPYICDICDSKFRSIDRLKFHKRIHLKQKPYSCEHCNRGFTVMYQLNKHKLIHTNDKPYTCKTCKKMFEAESELDEHKQMYKHPYKCIICDKLFCELRYFKKHNYRVHMGDEKIFYCDICRKDFKTIDELNSHKETHKGSYSCGVCQQTFADGNSLRKHKKSHNAKMRYSCGKCEMKFKIFRDFFEHGIAHEK